MIDEALEQFLEAQLAAQLGADYKKFRAYIFAINDRNKELAQTISGNESRILKLETMCASLATETAKLSSRLEKFENKERAEAAAAANVVLSKFNTWAANPVVPLPHVFTFLAGDFRIRTNQQIVQTPDESKWISNREGAKKYLLPNPNSFDQMTNILELYDMDQSMLREKGKNKIKIIEPCEISQTGFVEFPGKLQILL